MKQQNKARRWRAAISFASLGAGAGVAAAPRRSPATRTPTPRATMKSARRATRQIEHVKTFYRVNRYPS